MHSEDYLFTGPDWLSVDRNQRQNMAREIETIDADRLLNTSVDDLALYFEEKFRIDVPELNTGEIVVDQREKQIDVSHDPMRMIIGYGQPVYVTGSEVEVEIPFSGEPEAFQIRPNPYTLNPPRASIRGYNVIFSIVDVSLNTVAVKHEIDKTVASVQSYLAALRSNVSNLNSRLLAEARSGIEARRRKLLSDRNLVASLGFKMKQRTGISQTYVAPEIRRRITPVMPSAGASPYKPEPTLSMDDYDHILGIMQNMVQVMELSPSAFCSMDEEALRSHFLVQLNGHYEGQATGETFNYEGKTDILVRSDGRNIFIAECKFWAGQKKLGETIDQLLGYSSWRDTKVAVVVFNRNRDFSKVLATIPEAVRDHPQYKRDLPNSTDTVFRYCFANRDDKNRELSLTVLVFDVPSARS